MEQEDYCEKLQQLGEELSFYGEAVCKGKNDLIQILQSKAAGYYYQKNKTVCDGLKTMVSHEYLPKAIQDIRMLVNTLNGTLLKNQCKDKITIEEKKALILTM